MKRILKNMAITTLLLCSASLAMAAPVDVSYTTSGSSGAWIENFSVTNNLGGSNGIYFFGVQAPSTNIISSPNAGWNIATWDIPWSNAPYGGSSLSYNNVWCYNSCGGSTDIATGQTLSGFQVLFNTVAAPTSVNWFAYAFGDTYTGPGSFSSQNNPGFEGVAAAPVPEPETYAMLLVGLGLFGFMVRRSESNYTA